MNDDQTRTFLSLEVDGAGLSEVCESCLIDEKKYFISSKCLLPL